MIHSRKPLTRWSLVPKPASPPSAVGIRIKRYRLVSDPGAQRITTRG